MKPVEPPQIAGELRLKSLLASLHLASAALPVGGFAYSQGLETAIAAGDVADAAGARRWIEDLLRLVLARFEAPLWLRACDAHVRGDAARFAAINAELLAARETAELRLETQQMGGSLVRLFAPLGIAPPAADPIAYPAAFAAACAGLGVDRESGLVAYLWAWTENQVLAAVRTIPLGQQAGQSLLVALHEPLRAAVRHAAAVGDDELGSAPVGLALASARHETLYSRLYRS